MEIIMQKEIKAFVARYLSLCISVFGLPQSFAWSKKKVLDSTNFLIFKIQTLNSCGSPFLNKWVLLSFRRANNSYIILLLYTFNHSPTDWSLILNCIVASGTGTFIAGTGTGTAFVWFPASLWFGTIPSLLIRITGFTISGYQSVGDRSKVASQHDKPCQHSQNRI